MNNERKPAGLYIGLVFVIAGCLYLLNAFGLVDAEVFKGWWVLIILIPSILGLVSGKENRGICIIGVIVSACILIHYYLPDVNVFVLIVACALVLLGLRCIFPDFFRKKITEWDNRDDVSDFGRASNSENVIHETVSYVNENGETVYEDREVRRNTEGNAEEKKFCNNNPNGFIKQSVLFSGVDLKADGQHVTGASLSATFGGLTLDLRNAIIDRDIKVDLAVCFGGVEIYLPANVNLKLNSVPVLGGVDNKFRPSINIDENTPTVYINATCIFGGLDIY